MLRKSESVPNLKMAPQSGMNPVKPSMKTKKLIRRAVKAVGQENKARGAEETVKGLDRRASKAHMVNTNGMFFVGGVWKKASEKQPGGLTRINDFYWDVKKTTEENSGDLKEKRSNSYTNLSKKKKQPLMTKARAMSLMGLYSDYSETDVITAFHRDTKDICEKQVLCEVFEFETFICVFPWLPSK